MSNYKTAKEVLQLFGITKQTLYNWRKNKFIEFKQLNSRKILYNTDSILENQNQKMNVVYCRVSNTKQSDDLIRQKQIVMDYCSKNGIKIDYFYSEIASGMNENRIQFNKLIDDVINSKVKNIYITYRDRLTRFGFNYFKNLFEKYGCEIIEINTQNELSFESELTEDLISIIHHFSMKMYSNRRKALKEIEKQLKEE